MAHSSTKNAERQKRYREAKKAQKKDPITVPITKGQLRNVLENQRITDSAIIPDENGNTIIWFKKKKLDMKHVSTLYETTTALEKELPPEKKYSKRGRPEKTHHFGCWRKYQNEIAFTESYRDNEVAQSWVEKNMPLFDTMAFHFKQSFPELHKTYTDIEVPIRLGAWSTVAINFNYGRIGKHKDEHDYRNGLCWITTCGNYEGGELHFPGLNITIEIQPGDIIAFKSYLLEHEVLKYTGERYSIVLFQSHDMFFPSQ